MRTDTSMIILPSTNQARDFFGTICRSAEPNEAWALAIERIADATACQTQAIRGFLDSRYGRHFGEEVMDAVTGDCGLPTAISKTIERWMQRQIDDVLEEELGIPSGLPLLVGLVRMHEALLGLAGSERHCPNLLH